VQGAVLVPTSAGLHAAGHLRRLLLPIVAVGLALVLMAMTTPPPTQAGNLSEAQKIIRVAKSHIGARFRIGATGYRYFDCSGFVFRVYKQAGLLRRIGGSQMRAAGYFHWFKRRGLLSGRGHTGDLVWWKKHGTIKHIGIYIGHGQAVSALVNPWGVRKHSVGGIRMRFAAFGHVRLER
jgi:hypothetical protein